MLSLLNVLVLAAMAPPSAEEKERGVDCGITINPLLPPPPSDPLDLFGREPDLHHHVLSGPRDPESLMSGLEQPMPEAQRTWGYNILRQLEDLPQAELRQRFMRAGPERKPGARAAAVAKREKRMARNLRNRPTPAPRAA